MAEEKKKENTAKSSEQKKMTANTKIDAKTMENHPGWATITDNNMAQGVGVRDLQGVVGNAADLKARQHLLNPKNYKTEYKKPNPGKMPNNKDPFPVDLKIEEFEAHFPATRIYELTTHVHGQAAAKAAMNVGNNAEKRLIKLENNMATLTRLLFRMGARMRINCVYYGGQTPFEKYKCIRCLCDDRVSDGQNVQIDQCLYCTRYEPVDGQCYEIMNDLGVNVAVALDDNQMSYATIQDYVTQGRVEKYHEALDMAKVDLSTIKTRNSSEVDFDKAWGEGLKMDWKYVPKEDQKTHINWRQSINDDGSNIGRLASYPGNEVNAGYNIVGSDTNAMTSLMLQNRTAMDSFQGTSEHAAQVTQCIQNGKNIEGSKDDALNFFKGEQYNKIKAACKGKDVDPLTIACVGYTTNATDYDAVIKSYKDCATKIDTKNPAVIIAAMGTSPEVFTGVSNGGAADKRESYGGLPRFDLPLKPITQGGSSSSSDTDPNDPQQKVLNWKDRDKWLWAEIAERFVGRAELAGSAKDLALFPKACYLYCLIAPELSNSRFDEGDYGFPFFDEQFEKYGMNYASPYGMRTLNGKTGMHFGIDIGSEGGAEIHAVHDGTVKEDGTGPCWGDWHGICVDHGDGTYSRYLHCATMCVKTGQNVTKGQVIGTVGGFPSVPTHLHLEISPGDALATKSPQDPLDYFPKFRGVVNKGDALKPA